jgi:hypothetical protein
MVFGLGFMVDGFVFLAGFCLLAVIRGKVIHYFSFSVIFHFIFSGSPMKTAPVRAFAYAGGGRPWARPVPSRKG